MCVHEMRRYDPPSRARSQTLLMMRVAVVPPNVRANRPAQAGRLGPAGENVPCNTGRAKVATTMIYTHVLKVGGGGVRSPVDSLALE
jgi:hypothetical protein